MEGIGHKKTPKAQGRNRKKMTEKSLVYAISRYRTDVVLFDFEPES